MTLTLYLGDVDLSRLSFVRDNIVLATAQQGGCRLVILSKYTLTKHKTILVEPYGQRLCFISTALSA